MRVNVFVSEVEQDGTPTSMLVLPFTPDAVIPNVMQHIEWRYLATTNAGDSLIGFPRENVEFLLATDGYVLTTPKAGPR